MLDVPAIWKGLGSPKNLLTFSQEVLHCTDEFVTLCITDEFVTLCPELKPENEFMIQGQTKIGQISQTLCTSN
jgi:hypothetical protein